MTACLRTGATLHPSPLELAEKALVDAAVKWDKAGDELDRVPKIELHVAWDARYEAADKLEQAVAAYRALAGAK
mgnify:CR=1 FL=1